MRVRIERGARTETVEVDPERKVVRIGEREYAYEVARDGTDRVELEIEGERAVLDGWTLGRDGPPSVLEVNGERIPIRAVAVEGSSPPGAGRPEAAPPSAPAEGGQAIVAPLPGKVIEVKVQEGELVRRQQVLLILEAMKMRNEITSPIDGTVERLSARAGANVRPREPLLYVRPAAPP